MFPMQKRLCCMKFSMPLSMHQLQWEHIKLLHVALILSMKYYKELKYIQLVTIAQDVNVSSLYILVSDKNCQQLNLFCNMFPEFRNHNHIKLYRQLQYCKHIYIKRTRVQNPQLALSGVDKNAKTKLNVWRTKPLFTYNKE